MNRTVHQVVAGILAFGLTASSPAIFAQQTQATPMSTQQAEQAARQRLLAAIQKQGVQLDSVEIDLVLNGDAAQLGAVVQEAVRVIEARSVAASVAAPAATSTTPSAAASAVAAPAFEAAVTEIVAAVVTQPALVTAVAASIVAAKPEAAATVQAAVVAAVQQVQQAQQAAASGQTAAGDQTVLAMAQESAPISVEQVAEITAAVEQSVNEAADAATTPVDNTAAPVAAAPSEQQEVEVNVVEETPDEPTASPS
jgi:hypothetical protein